MVGEAIATKLAAGPRASGDNFTGAVAHGVLVFAPLKGEVVLDVLRT
jgi:hypothetical protein